MASFYLVVIISVLLAFQAFASSSETALFSLNRFQLRRLRERQKRAHARIKELLAHPTRLLILILFVTEVVGVAVSAITTKIMHRVQGDLSWTTTALISSVVSLTIIVLFGEITPKVIATRMNRVVSIVNSKFLIVLYYALMPVLWPAEKIIQLVLRKFMAAGHDPLSRTTSVLSEEDLLALMDQGAREGTVDPAERAMIQRVLDLDDRKASDLMTPLQQAFSVSASAPLSEALPEIRSQKYSRVPVYQKSRRHIVGILYVKDLLSLRERPDMGEVEVKSMMTKPMYVSPDVTLSTLFRRLKSQRTHMAICVDEEEQALGVITMEDVLESIFGEIADETDKSEAPA